MELIYTLCLFFVNFELLIHHYSHYENTTETTCWQEFPYIKKNV